MSDTARDYQTIDAAATEGLEDLFEPQASTSQASSDQGLATPDQPHPAQADDLLVTELRQQIADLKLELNNKVLEAQREIQAAAFRNGYLESQLENEREQIKLLTDSQHKPGRWTQFSTWFFKGR